LHLDDAINTQRRKELAAFAEGLRQLGLDAVYEPSLEVVHQEHKSTKLVKSRKLGKAVATSAAYCADTYFPLK